MNIKISCIIPYYNVEKELLVECVNSILKQDFQDYEILIVNDGSDENYTECLEEVSCFDSRIQIIQQSNQGVSVARNKGMYCAKGEYITFVDADDMVMPFFFSQAYNVAKKNEADYVVGCVLNTSCKDIEMLQDKNPEIKERTVNQYRPTLIQIVDRIPNGGYFSRGPVARLIRRDISSQVLFPEEVVLGEDIIWNLDVVSKCDKIFMVYQIWYQYWKNPKSISHMYNENIVFICKQHLETLIKKINLENLEEVIAYDNHIFELLYKNIYLCYLKEKECPLSVLEKAHMFRELSEEEPWKIYQSDYFLRHCDKKTKIKYWLNKFGLLYWFWFFKDKVKRDKKL